MTCAFDGCGGNVWARGWCSSHYQQWRKGKVLSPLRRPKTTCSIENCEGSHHCHGWCIKHYERWRKHGSPYWEPPRQSLAMRLAEKIEVKPSGCYEWVAAKDPLGYGRFTVGEGAKGKLAHRIVYEKFVGPITDGLTLDHLCRNTSCVNPDHLEPVTQQENIRRGDWFINAHREGRDCGHEACRSCQRFRNREHKMVQQSYGGEAA